MLSNYIKYVGMVLFGKLTNYAKYTGLINYISNNSSFYINKVDVNLSVSNLPTIENKEIIQKFDVIIGFIGENEQGNSETKWINKLPQIKYYHVPVTDYTAPSQHDYEKLLKILHNHRHQNILMHCYAGKGRSNCGAVIYLMDYYGMNPEEAIAEVRRRIPRSGMNRWQEESLREFYRNKLNKNKKSTAFYE